MATIFELMFNFSTKLESDLPKKGDKVSGYGVFALSSDFIEYLIIC